jgi:hypothetical protein
MICVMVKPNFCMLDISHTIFCSQFWENRYIVVFCIFFIVSPFLLYIYIKNSDDNNTIERVPKFGRFSNLKNAFDSLTYCLCCGYKPAFPPWGKDGKSPSMEICPCCGVQFGNEDKTFESLKTYRSKWISNGAKWFSKEDKPEGWDMDAQMKNIPEEFL